MVNTISLTVNEVEIPFAEIPMKIAVAITPLEQASTVRISLVCKAFPLFDQKGKVVDEKGNVKYEIEALTDVDWRLLDETFSSAKLPVFRPIYGNGGMDWSEWSKYENALEERRKYFGEAEDMGTRIVAHGDTILNMVSREHLRQLTKAVASGRVTVYNKLSHIKLESTSSLLMLDDAYMRADDFKQYIQENFHLQVVVGEIEGGQVTVTSDYHTSSSTEQPAQVSTLKAVVDVKPPSDIKSESGLTKREKQIQAIERFADALGYKRNAIPDGGKPKLMQKCIAELPNLFGVGEDPFLGAWKQAVKEKRIRMEHHESYARK